MEMDWKIAHTGIAPRHLRRAAPPFAYLSYRCSGKEFLPGGSDEKAFPQLIQARLVRDCFEGRLRDGVWLAKLAASLVEKEAVHPFGDAAFLSTSEDQLIGGRLFHLLNLLEQSFDPA